MVERKKKRVYVAIDLKSFYASVECRERGLDPLKTNLVVADASRTEKTICLAVSPSLKAWNISGRARLFEVVQRVKEINAVRQAENGGKPFSGESYDDDELRADPSRKLSYIAAPPRMALYMEFSNKIYDIYLRFVAPEDIHVYSIDEVFMDVTDYLKTYGCTARELARRMVGEVLAETGITATVGIGSNLYLAKIAMDIYAKHQPADEDGLRMAELDEISYRQQLWSHRPITDFWRIGRGYARRLAAVGIYTMGDVARCSVGRPEEFYNEDLLYRLFGVNAELLIDHAWGYEPCTIADVKAYRPASNSLGSGQVLAHPYEVHSARIVLREMIDLLVLDLVRKGLVTDQIVLTVMYDIENLKDPAITASYHGPVTTDYYGRKTPKHAHGTTNFPRLTSSTKEIVEGAVALFDRIVNPALLVRRIYITANHVQPEPPAATEPDLTGEQLDFFTDYAARERAEKEAAEGRKQERHVQKAILDIQQKFGKNASLKGTNLEDGATTIERNKTIGGHKA